MEDLIRENYEKWLSSPVVDEATKAELRGIAGDETELKSRFMSYLSFGTAGLRGTMAAGTNRMNVYTVAHATQGLADLIIGCSAAERGVAVAYDSRNNSRLFAETAASVPDARSVVRAALSSLHRGHKRNRVAQSEGVQRLQGVLGGRSTAPARPRRRRR